MKKSLSFLLAIAMVFGLFASVVSAAESTTELTAQQKFDLLKDKGIFQGIEQADGTTVAGLDQEMNRAQFARIAALLSGLEGIGNPDTKVVTEKPFDDVELGKWYTEEVAAVKEAGIMIGNGDGTFGTDDKIQVQQLAVVAAKLLGLEEVADATVDGAANYAAGWIQALTNAGVAFPTNYTDNATRGQLVESAFMVDTAKNPSTVTATAAQSGVKKITVTFNRALTDAEKADLTYEVKYGFVPYTVTPTVADDSKSVTLESSFNFPAGDYTVTVKGFDAMTVTVVAEKATKLDIGTENLKADANQDLKVKVYNQFGEEMKGAVSDANISVYNGSKGLDLTTGASDVLANGKLDLSNDTNAKVDDTVIVTVTHPTTGLSASKTFKVVAASTIKSLSFGPVAPLKDKTRITVGETGLAIPYTLVDQYGENITLAAGGPAATHGDLTFYSSNNAVVDPATFVVDADGKLTFTAGGTAGTAIITALNAKGGVTTTFSIKVDDVAKVKTFVINHPGVLVAANEDVKIPFMATDTFDKPLTTADFAKSALNSQVTFAESHPTIAVASSFDTKTGDLKFKFTGGTGQVTVYAWVGGTIAGQITVDVKAAATPTKITGIKDVNTLFAPSGEFTLNYKDNVVAVDNYGRAIAELPAGYDFTVAVKDATTTVTSVTYGTKTITGVADGSKTIVLTLTNAGTPVASSSYEFSAKVIKLADVTGYEIEAISDRYIGASGATFTSVASAGDYAKGITLVGKDASGNKVNIDQASIITALTSSDGSIVGTDFASLKLFGKKKGTATVAAWAGAKKLAEVTVNTSDAAPVATTVKFANAEDTVDVGASIDLDADLTVKDQYGVVIANTGTWASSDTTKATVDATGNVDGVAAGEVTISFVSSNGNVASVLVTVTTP